MDTRFRLLFERIDDPMLLLDVESGVFIDWNPAALRMLRYPAREAVPALRPADISPPLQPDGRDSGEKAREMMDIARRNGSHRFEWTVCSPYRSEVVIEVLLTTIAIDGREVFINTWRDISRHKRTEDDLLANKLRWKYALEGAGDGVWDWNVLTGTVFFSRRWKTMLGYEDADIGDDVNEWATRVHPDDLQRVMSDVQAHLEGRAATYRNEHRMLCRNGEYKWILDRGKVVSRDADGRPLRMVGTHTDITERRRVQTELERAEATQRALLDAMADGVFVAQDHRFVFVNPALHRMLGYTVEEFTGLHFAQVLHPDYLDLWSERYESRIGTGPEPQHRYEVQLLHRDGSQPLWIELIASRFIYRDAPAVLGIVRDISDKKINEQTIWKQANYDALTNLPNRQMLLHQLRQEMRLSERSGRKLAVLFIDLDRFKEVNDTLGHPAGDNLLQQAAARITGCMRDTDTVARFGGDEFAVVLGGLEQQEMVEQIVGKILSALHQPFRLFDELVYVSASIGITLYPDSALNQEDLLKQADQAMYDAKRAGRNRMSYFTPSMQAGSERRLRLVSDMHTALLTNQFALHYQPIIDIASGRVHKAEALLRWVHPERGNVSPEDFIPIAEETGLILPLGDWVTRTAIGFARHLQQSFDRSIQISINHSPVQLRNRNRDYPSVVELLRQLQQPGSLVAIEMTEGMLIEADENSLEGLYAMRDAGVQVALDDFGTGYSSLSYLKKFDIDYLKIDQSFVRGLSRDSSELVLCEAMIVMAHKLGMQVIAEGVETAQQLDLLRAAGCDFAQGFLFARPLQAKHFEAWLRENG